MRFGVSFASAPAMVPVALEAERLGYDTVHFYDTPLVCSDPFVVAGLVADRTERITIAISVAIPFLRLPHVLATSVGTLNQIAPGRIVLGFGTGYTAALTTGSRPDSWATVREHIRVCQDLLAGGETQVVVKGETRTICHLHPERGFVNVTDPVPVYVSATGSKGLAVAAEVADGIYTLTGARRLTADELAPRIADFRRRAAQHGKENVPVIAATAIAVRDADEQVDSPRLRAFQGPWVTSHLHGDLGGGAEDPNTPAVARDAVARYRRVVAGMRADAPWIENHRGHSIFVRPEEEELISSELLTAVCQIGTKEELIAEIRDLEAVGVDELLWQVVPGFEEELGRFARDVIIPYRAGGGVAAG
jgi:5,10-methylenetetrahydromethanopterin reductase